MGGRRRNRKRKEASASEAGDHLVKRNQASGSEGVEVLRLKEARAPEGGEILRLKKEALKAIRAVYRKTEETQTAGSGKKKVVKKKVSQAYIDSLKEGLYPIFPEIPEEEMAKHCKDFRHFYTGHTFCAEKIRAYERAILAQYDALGYAEDESEVSDEEASDDKDDKVQPAN